LSSPAFDIVCLGESLVDLLPARPGLAVRSVPAWYPCVGGAPANVAVQSARLGARSALVGVTGDDEFGHFLKRSLGQEGVDVSGLRQTAQGKTGLGFVSLTAQGERSFLFYRHGAAETYLSSVDTRRASRMSTRVLHVGTNSLVQPSARSAVLRAVSAAHKAGVIVSVDPNLRLHLWPKPKVLQALLRELLPKCSLVKLSEEEIVFVTGRRSPAQALQELARWGVQLPIVTLGAAGACAQWLGHVHAVPTRRVKVVDTTGAGDGFMAGCLHALTRKAQDAASLVALAADDITKALRAGCAVGSKVVTHLGAVGLPKRA
jgi:fructokinase